MNARGLVELVILDVGLEIGLISPPLFTMMVIMAPVTTVITTPLLERIHPSPAAVLTSPDA
jgi:Kef-type K+ transport system membrane component KefB